jgi:acid phosphatase type 7
MGTCGDTGKHHHASCPEALIRHLGQRIALLILSFLPLPLAGQSDTLVGIAPSCGACDASYSWRFAAFDAASTCPADNGWLFLGFDDSLWQEGCTPLGYGETFICSSVSAGTMSVFARKVFTVADPAAYESLTLRVLYDDGFVAYLNGTQIVRRPSSGTYDPTSCKASAGQDHEAVSYEEFSILPSYLVAGSNVLALQAHNNNSTSTDLVLSAQLLGIIHSPPQITKGPWLQQVSRGSVVVMWETDRASPSRVQWGRLSPEENSASDPSLTQIHEVAVTGLSSHERYLYYVQSDETQSPTYSFMSAPEFDTGFRAVAFGDTRTEIASHTNTVNAIIPHRPQLELHTGDFATEGRTYSQWGPQFFAPEQPLLANVPLWTTPGNHDYLGTGTFWYDSLFSLPTGAGTERWYATTYGCCRLVSLDSNQPLSAGSPQLTWLQAELASWRYRQAAWRIVYFHHPPFSSCPNHPPSEAALAAVRNNVVPLLEAEPRAHAAIAGHLHLYERSLKEGIAYLTAGGGGAPLQNLISNYTPHNASNPYSEYGETLYHFIIADVTPFTMKLRPIRVSNGSVFDPTAYASAVPRLHGRSATRIAAQRINAVKTDSTGHIVAAGAIRNEGGDSDVYVARLTAAGSVVWEAVYDGGYGDDQAIDIALGANGNTYVAASSTTESGDRNWVTLAYDETGDEVWSEPGGGSGDDDPVMIAAIGAGDVAVTGTVRNGEGRTDIVTVMFPASGGAPSWQRTYASSDGDGRPCGLIADSSGDLYVAGSAYHAATGWDGILIKYRASDGQEQWAVPRATTADETFAGAVFLGESVYVAGTVTNASPDVLFLAFSAATGAEGWSQVWDGSGGADTACGIVEDGLGFLALAATSEDASLKEGIVVLRYLDRGTAASLVGSKRFDRPAGTEDEARCLAADGKGNLYVAGATTSPEGDRDLLGVKFDANLEIIWDEEYASESGGPDEASCVAVGNTGGVAIGGSTGDPSSGIVIAINQTGALGYVIESTPVRLETFNALLKGALGEPAGAYELYLTYDSASLEFESATLAATDWEGSEFFDAEAISPGLLRIVAVRSAMTEVPPVGFGTDIGFARLVFAAREHAGPSWLDMSASHHSYFVDTAWDPEEKPLVGERLDFAIADATYFVRGNVNGSLVDPGDPRASVDLSDVVYLLSYLFQEGAVPPCMEAADTIHDDTLRLIDAVYLLQWCFGDAAPLPEPFAAHGEDLDGDSLDCQQTQL